MRNKYPALLTGMLALLMLQFAVISSQAQIIATNGNTVIINNFDDNNQIVFNDNLTDGGVPGNGTLFPYQNWFGTAFSNVVWDASDAGAPGDNPGSGSMLIQSYFPNGGVGGMYGSQFVVFAGFASWTNTPSGGVALANNPPFNPPFLGYGSLLTNTLLVTNFSCDIRFAPFSATNANGTFPTVEFGTEGADPGGGQYDFGQITLQATNTNWVHVSIPLAASAIWSNIPNLYVKIFSGLGSDPGNDVPVFLYVDNLEFQLGIPPTSHPTLNLEKATSGLRIFAQGGQYSRTQIATVDTNQSWVGGSYPKSYSVTVAGYNPDLAVNEFHWFWLTPAFNSGALNQYSDYSSDLNTLRLNITQGVAGTGANGTVQAEIRWKVNLLNSNGTNVVLNITNSTMIGTWTVTFNSATSGTLTPPGGSPAAFTIDDPNIATDFANPVVFEFGMQPDPSTSIGSYVDISHAQTVGVAGTPVNYDFTGGTVDTNIWLTGSVSTANGVGLVPVNAVTAPYWVSWTTPDIGETLVTKADLGNKTIPWKTPNYYASYPTNSLTVIDEGTVKWKLIPPAALPTVDGTSNGVKSANAFFLMQNPPPAQ